jgi:hypothetical protein
MVKNSILGLVGIVRETMNYERHKLLWVKLELWEQKVMVRDNEVFWEKQQLWEK